ncbi:MAG: D-alanine--D-alanine ligase [Burkholderiales bacterium]|nr:D-alanine--D-alanine ligase [Burkholderiales bacterium]
MNILIAFAAAAERPVTATQDSLADVATLEQVKAIEDVLVAEGHGVRRLALNIGARERFVKDLLEPRPDIVINLVESVGTDNRGQSYLPALLELLQIPYTGAGPASLAVCTDKWMSKGVLAQAGLPVPPGALVAAGEQLPSHLSYPLFIKPAYEDASIGIDNSAVCVDEAAALLRLQYVVTHYHTALVEEYIDGREINAAVSDEAGGHVYPLSEIDMTALPAGIPRIVTFNAKWLEESPEYEQTPGICPAPLPLDVAERIQTIALRAYRALHVRGYARVDCRLTPAGKVYILEVNANPDVSTWSGYLRSWKAGGGDYTSFVRYLLDECRNIPKI